MHSASTVQGFVVNMAKVFEDFLTAGLSDALRRIDGHVAAQQRCFLDLDAQVVMKPDLLWRVGGAPVAVIDAKYKIEHTQESDLYQMLAYCTALGLPVGHLVYAKGNVQPRVYDVVGGVRIYAHALDLDATPDLLVGQVQRLASVIHRTRVGALALPAG